MYNKHNFLICPTKKKPKRRDFLYTASYTVGAAGIGAAIGPLIKQMNHDRSVIAIARTKDDVSLE